MLKSKIHRATVTNSNVDYEGSITIPSSLLKAANILPYEKVHVLDVTNGVRLETYAMEGEEGMVCANGAAAKIINKGDTIIILSYILLTGDEIRWYEPSFVFLNEENKIKP